LEFLGDAVLSSVVSESLFLQSPDQEEGGLSLKRDAIISRSNLNKIAKRNFKKVSFYYKTKSVSENMYGNYLEAIIGAIYLDKGLLATKEFIQRLILTGEEISVKNQDFKSELYLLAKKQRQKINFVQLEQSGPDHKKSHKIGLMIDEKIVDSCWSPTIKDAEIKLSKKRLSQIK
jgi:ribonuclease-3